MTTPANNGPHGGANKPEDDDPFGYLYADGQAAGATPPGSGGGYGYPGPAAGGHPGTQPGVPRTSHHQVRTVGDRRSSGGPRGPVPQQGQPPYQAQYQAPEALQAGGYGVPPQAQPPQHQTQTLSHSGGHGGGGGGSSRKGLIIAAIAVVGAVAIGIGAAVAFGGKDEKKDDKADGGQQSAAPQDPASPAPSGGSPKPSEAPLPKGEAAGAGMVLSGGAQLQSTVPGSKSSGGQYVGNFNQPGAAVTWSLDVPKAGKYKFYVRFGIPGEDADGTLTVNGTPNGAPISMRNFAKSPKGDWEKGWQTTWGQVTLVQGANTVKLSCEAGNKCNVNIDQLWLERF
ncbi:carbohydrate-binding protein [Streptomyces sp. CB00455]|uniref:CBM35 domain-containing protein n=1 Tax=Streptomyces sp. CB00455 TaxID=1703927 RepID=UPI00093A7EB1|nr:CBM35 domain-containing protein [Streptomyces sp. CB00455]OKK13117.1 carbohydrate-binding protein [Streptomyces sp. CB00455]